MSVSLLPSLSSTTPAAPPATTAATTTTTTNVDHGHDSDAAQCSSDHKGSALDP